MTDRPVILPLRKAEEEPCRYALWKRDETTTQSGHWIGPAAMIYPMYEEDIRTSGQGSII